MRKVGIRDVAERAGVALGTVSHFINHPERVSQEKAERIRAAIDELGFVPNNVGRQLRLGESNVIAYLAPDVSNPFFASVAEAVERRAAELNLSVFVANSHRDRAREDEYLQLFERYRVRGMLVASHGQIEDRLALVRKRGTPVVLFGQRAVADEQPSVSVDEVMGGRLAGEHLLGTGRRRIAFVGGPLSIHQVAGRLQGVSGVVRDSGSAMLEVIDVADRTIEVGRVVGREIAGRSPAARPDAVFAVNDMLALGLMREFVVAGIRVPDEIAVIGYDDIAFAGTSIVPLSSIRTPHSRLGVSAVDLLLENARGGVARHEAFEPELVVRESTVSGAGEY